MKERPSQKPQEPKDVSPELERLQARAKFEKNAEDFFNRLEYGPLDFDQSAIQKNRELLDRLKIILDGQDKRDDKVRILRDRALIAERHYEDRLKNAKEKATEEFSAVQALRETRAGDYQTALEDTDSLPARVNERDLRALKMLMGSNEELVLPKMNAQATALERVAYAHLKRVYRLSEQEIGQLRTTFLTARERFKAAQAKWDEELDELAMLKRKLREGK